MATVPKGKRADLPDTREELLRAATQIFAEKGYAATTIRQICALANVNLALVNYHFSSKQELYAAVKQNLFQDIGIPLLATITNVTDADSWQKAIYSWVDRVLALAAADKPPALWAARMLAMEHIHPSEVTPEINHIRQQFRDILIRLIRMGLPTDETQAKLWANSIIAQCLFHIFDFPGWLTADDTESTRREWVHKIRDHLLGNFFAKVTFQTADIQ